MTPAPKRSNLPDAVRRAVERTFQSTLGSRALSRERAQELVDEVVRQAEAGAARAGRGVREAGHRLTGSETEDLKGEVERLRRRVNRLERELRERKATGDKNKSGRKQKGKA